MRLIATFLCFFLFVLASGTVSFVYLMWTNYWLRVQATETQYSFVARQAQAHRPRRRGPGRPADPPAAAGPGPGSRELAGLAGLPRDKLAAHISTYREQLLTQLRTAVTDTAKQVHNIDRLETKGESSLGLSMLSPA